jgi:hypothetical protein
MRGRWAAEALPLGRLRVSPRPQGGGRGSGGYRSGSGQSGAGQLWSGAGCPIGRPARHFEPYRHRTTFPQAAQLQIPQVGPFGQPIPDHFGSGAREEDLPAVGHVQEASDTVERRADVVAVLRLSRAGVALKIQRSLPITWVAVQAAESGVK